MKGIGEKLRGTTGIFLSWVWIYRYNAVDIAENIQAKNLNSMMKTPPRTVALLIACVNGTKKFFLSGHATSPGVLRKEDLIHGNWEGTLHRRKLG